MAESLDRFQPGRMSPEITLITPAGSSINIGSRRNRNNLVLVLLGESAASDPAGLVEALTQHSRGFDEETTEVFVTTPSAQTAESLDRRYPDAPFLTVHWPTGEPARNDTPAPVDAYAAALVLIDRFGEVITTWRLSPEDSSSGAIQEVIADALAEVRFIELQCPE